METLHLFIDTNVYLSFYEYSKDNLERIGELNELIRNKEITLWLPQQVEDEFNRNREKKLSKLMGELRERKEKLSKSQYPRICQDHALFEEVHKLQKLYSDKFAELIKALDKNISSTTLGADKAIKGLFDSAEPILRTNDLIDSAVRRKHIGNPPGKKGSLGDEIIWEMLLVGVPSGQKLFIASGDGDYISFLKKEQIKTFLKEEWQKNKKAEIVLYRELAQFLKEFYPNIKLELENRIDTLVDSLSRSFCFDRTRSVIVQLLEYRDFNEYQVNKLARCCYENSQVGWILQDSDVKKFYNKLLLNHSSLLEKGLKDKLANDMSRIKRGSKPSANDIGW